MRGPLVLAVLSAALAACGGRDPPFRWRDGAAAVVEVRVREALSPGSAAREIRISTRGVVERSSEIALEIMSVGHESVRGDGTVTTVDTETSGASPSERASEDAAIARVAEGLVGRKIRLTFDPVDGLRAVAGMDDALRSAAPAADPAAAAARDGFVPLLSDTALLRSLRGAGLAAAPENFKDSSAVIERRVELFVPGRGTATCRMLGTVRFEHYGAPVVDWSGRLAGDADVVGPPGEPPPPEVGDVLLGRTEAEAETTHDAVRATPRSGRLTLRMPFARGASVVTTTSFDFAADE